MLQGASTINPREYTHYARILSPRGAYPADSIFFDDAAYLSDSELAFSVAKYTKHTRGGDEDSYSEVQWLNPTETKLYGSLMLAVDRDESYVAFYPYPYTVPIVCPSTISDKKWLLQSVKTELSEKLIEEDIIHPGYTVPARNSYKYATDIAMPPMVGGPEYDFRSNGIDYELAKNLYKNISINDSLVIRGLCTLVKAAMLRSHYQFLEEAIYSLFISMEVSFRLVLRELKNRGINNPTSKDAMTFIHDAFYDIHRVDKYFEEYYEGRVMSFHPESRLGTHPHAPLMADDYSFLFNDMLEVYTYLICGYVHPKHKEKISGINERAT